MVLNAPSRSALRPVPATTTASADFLLQFPPSPFQARGEISPGKNALLHCTTAGFTSLRLDHKSFAVSRPLALLGNAFYPVLVHRLAVSLCASSPRSVALPQLRFTSLAVVSSRRDFHPQECAHAGRTKKPPCAMRAVWNCGFTHGGLQILHTAKLLTYFEREPEPPWLPLALLPLSLPPLSLLPLSLPPWLESWPPPLARPLPLPALLPLLPLC